MISSPILFHPPPPPTPAPSFMGSPYSIPTLKSAPSSSLEIGTVLSVYDCLLLPFLALIVMECF